MSNKLHVLNWCDVQIIIFQDFFSPIFALSAMSKTEETQLFGPDWSERLFRGEN